MRATFITMWGLRLDRSRASITAIVLVVMMLCSPPVAAAPSGQSAARPGVARLPSEELLVLRRNVAEARALDARPFAEVARIVAQAPELDARARARKAPIALYLAKLGTSALMPALEMLAFELPRTVPEASIPSIRRELIEVVGLVRDPRGLRVLFAVLGDATEDIETTRTAAEAIARIGTEDAAAKLVSMLGAARDERARAILGGMGECRRRLIAEAIAERLRTTTDEATARVAIRSLGRTGNAWAWKTMADRSDEMPIRRTAASALVDAYARGDGDVRDAATKALMVVDAPETAALIAHARNTAAPGVAKALDELAVRFARNPAR